MYRGWPVFPEAFFCKEGAIICALFVLGIEIRRHGLLDKLPSGDGWVCPVGGLNDCIDIGLIEEGDAVARTLQAEAVSLPFDRP